MGSQVLWKYINKMKNLPIFRTFKGPFALGIFLEIHFYFLTSLIKNIFIDS